MRDGFTRKHAAELVRHLFGSLVGKAQRGCRCHPNQCHPRSRGPLRFYATGRTDFGNLQA